MRRCLLCRSSKIDDIKYGKFLTKNKVGVHTFCLYLTSNLSQRGKDHEGFCGFLLKDIEEERKRISKLYCCYCGESYASIGCCEVKCRRSFHLICGLNNGAQNQFTGTYRSFCNSHARGEKRRPDANEKCSICYSTLGIKFDAINMLIAPCCHSGWFHKFCLQRYAQSAGYFFKCPLCNDDRNFRKQLPYKGIFIPDCDASWELEPNAYADLLERPSECSAQHCKHRSGAKNKELLICTTCGSLAIHRQCMSSKSYSFQCDLCKKIVPDGIERIQSDDEDVEVDVCNINNEKPNNCKENSIPPQQNSLEAIEMSSKRTKSKKNCGENESSSMSYEQPVPQICNVKIKRLRIINDSDSERGSEPKNIVSENAKQESNPASQKGKHAKDDVKDINEEQLSLKKKLPVDNSYLRNDFSTKMNSFQNVVKENGNTSSDENEEIGKLNVSRKRILRISDSDSSSESSTSSNNFAIKLGNSFKLIDVSEYSTDESEQLNKPNIPRKRKLRISDSDDTSDNRVTLYKFSNLSKDETGDERCPGKLSANRKRKLRISDSDTSSNCSTSQSNSSMEADSSGQNYQNDRLEANESKKLEVDDSGNTSSSHKFNFSTHQNADKDKLNENVKEQFTRLKVYRQRKRLKTESSSSDEIIETGRDVKSFSKVTIVGIDSGQADHKSHLKPERTIFSKTNANISKNDITTDRHDYDNENSVPNAFSIESDDNDPLEKCFELLDKNFNATTHNNKDDLSNLIIAANSKQIDQNQMPIVIPAGSGKDVNLSFVRSKTISNLSFKCKVNLLETFNGASNDSEKLWDGNFRLENMNKINEICNSTIILKSKCNVEGSHGNHLSTGPGQFEEQLFDLIRNNNDVKGFDVVKNSHDTSSYTPQPFNFFVTHREPFVKIKLSGDNDNTKEPKETETMYINRISCIANRTRRKSFVLSANKLQSQCKKEDTNNRRKTMSFRDNHLTEPEHHSTKRKNNLSGPESDPNQDMRKPFISLNTEKSTKDKENNNLNNILKRRSQNVSAGIVLKNQVTNQKMNISPRITSAAKSQSNKDIRRQQTEIVSTPKNTNSSSKVKRCSRIGLREQPNNTDDRDPYIIPKFARSKRLS